MSVEIRINQNNIFDSANKYFEEYKKLKQKAERISKLIEEYKMKLNNIELEIEKENRKQSKKYIKKEWYHKFRWFFTTNNFLVVIGKDKISNEVLIRKYLFNNDLVFHAEGIQSPFGILKNGQNAKEIDIKEAAQFVASFSKAWKHGFSSFEVFYVKPEQVSKKAPSGEYLTKGAFMIYGKKNYVRVELKISIGVDENYNIIPGVPTSVFSKTSNYITIVPGEKKPSEIAKEISKILDLDVNDIMKFIPGPSRILEINKKL